MLGSSKFGFLSSKLLLVIAAMVLLGGSPILLLRPSPAQTKTQPSDQKPGSPPAPVAAVTKNITQKPGTKAAESLPPAGPLDFATKTEVHAVAPGESLPSLAFHYLPQTPYMTRSEFEAAIQQANSGKLGTYLRPGTQINLPGILVAPLAEKPVVVPRDFEMRGIYLTGWMAGSDKGLELIRRWRAAGGNTVVFDAKDFDGLISVPFDHPLAPKGKHVPIRNLPKLISFLHSLGLHAIVRIAVFRDETLVTEHSDLAVQSRSTGKAWRENGKLVWTDPSRPEVQDYNLALARMAAAAGADEIQFDYVRFPAEGNQKDARFAYEATHPEWQRSDVLVKFVARAYEMLHPMGVLFSLDVFGVMAWQRSVDLLHTGQDIPALAKHCDVLSPMIYPSHFFKMDGYTSPGDAPEHFISRSMARFVEITADSKVVLRPWLQAFAWHTKTYSEAYIRTQVSVAKGQGGVGFLFWNARNDYTKVFPAMAEMRAEPGHFFRGDEIQAAHRKLAANVTPSNSSGAK